MKLFPEHFLFQIADFSISTVVTPGRKYPPANFGTLMYQPPEIVRLQHFYPMRVDIWTAGVIIYVLVHGDYPFRILKRSKMLSAMKRKSFPKKGLSPELVELLEKLLENDPAARPEVLPTIGDKWLVPFLTANSARH